MKKGMEQKLTSSPERDAKTTDPEAGITFAEIYSKYYASVLKKARWYNANDPESTTQDVFEKAFKHFDNYKYIGYSYKTWLYRILLNTIISEKRRDNGAISIYSTDEEELLDHLDKNSTGFDADAEFKELELNSIMNKIQRSLASQKKPKTWYDMIYRTFVLHETQAEISEDMGIKLGSVHSGLFRAYRALADDHELHDMLTGNYDLAAK